MDLTVDIDGDVSDLDLMTIVWSYDDDEKKYTILYRLLRTILVTDQDTGRTITVPKGYEVDGATYALDDPRLALAWTIHDWVCEFTKWDDGSGITAWEAARILWILIRLAAQEFKVLWFYGRAWGWNVMTFAFGCVKTRKNGWF